ncbi:MAG: maltokinase N-terminal cap-like domain-containing protein [Candidatus Limnocylindria bacterium]
MTLATPDWLRTQRWFRSKQRPISSVIEVDRAEVPGVELRILEVAYADGGIPDRYLLPTTGGDEPQDGHGAWQAIATVMADGAEVRARHGRFIGWRTEALEDLVPSAAEAIPALGERRLTVEQSNTSVVLGDRLILKVYRLLESGDNPDLEVSAFLTRAGFADTPPVAGGLAYEADDGQSSTAAMLQAFVPSRGDAWAAMLSALAEDPARGIEVAAAVGRTTAAMHGALASEPGNPAFPARPATSAEAAAWRTSAERQLAEAVTAVRGDDHARMVEVAPRVTERFADTFGAASGAARVSRIHGDYHLGQLLALADGGLSVIDFEGEPARPMQERSAPSSPLRDVAGLLRSLDYAARTAQRDNPAFDPDAWLADARQAFKDGYGDIGPLGGTGLLDAFELEKACYEVRYEANNRPDWLWLPLAAVHRLAASPA